MEDRERDTAAPESSAVDAAVFPSPVAFVLAMAFGGLIGFSTIYGLSERQANPAFGIALVSTLFAVAMAGPRLIADAQSEIGRTVGVALNALAFGGTFAGIIVLL